MAGDQVSDSSRGWLHWLPRCKIGAAMIATTRCPDRLKSFAIQWAVNCVAGSIPAAFLLMIDGNISRVVLLKSLIIGTIFSNAIGFPARFMIPRLYPGIA